MSLWVYVNKIKRQSFLTLDDFHVINYHEIREFVMPRYKGIDELPEYPYLKEVRRYIQRNENETIESYYDRALEELPKLQEYYSKCCSILDTNSKEQEYLEDNKNYQELFFDKRCFELAEQLREVFESELSKSNYFDIQFPIVIKEKQLEQFNLLANQNIAYEEGYIYKLSVG